MSIDHIISEICNSRIGEVILIDDNTTLLDYEEANTSMGLSNPRSKLIYHDDTIFKSWIDYLFIHVHKSVLVIMQGCTRDSE